MAERNVLAFSGKSCETPTRNWCVANVSPQCSTGSTHTQFEGPGSLGGQGMWEIPVSTPDKPYTEIPNTKHEPTAKFLLDRNCPFFGKYDRGLRPWYLWWPGKEDGVTCPENEATMALIKAHAEGKKFIPKMDPRVNRPDHAMDPKEARRQSIPQLDEATPPAQLQKIIDNNGLAGMIPEKANHKDRVMIVRTALLTRQMDGKMVSGAA